MCSRKQLQSVAIFSRSCNVSELHPRSFRKSKISPPKGAWNKHWILCWERVPLSSEIITDDLKDCSTSQSLSRPIYSHVGAGHLLEQVLQSLLDFVG